MPSDLPAAVHFPLNSLAISGCPESGANLYPTRMVEAFGSTVARTTAFAYNCASGRVTTRRDVDNSLTQTYGYDSLAHTQV